jgi:hypothetical protein
MKSLSANQDQIPTKKNNNNELLNKTFYNDKIIET